MKYEFVTLWRAGSTDGYRDSYEDHFYLTSAEAEHAGREKYGSFWTTPKSFRCIKFDDGSIYVVDGPYHLVSEGPSDDEIRVMIENALKNQGLGRTLKRSEIKEWIESIPMHEEPQEKPKDNI